jgi:hypothetical protein
MSVFKFPSTTRKTRLQRIRTGDLVCRPAFAGRNQDQQFDDAVVDTVSSSASCLRPKQRDALLAAALDDEHVLVSYGASDLNAGLAIGKLLESALGRGRSKTFANSVRKSGMRGT